MQCSNLNRHIQSMHIVESSACSCGFVNEDEFHFFFGCPLFNRPRIILQNVISSVAPFTLRTLLYGVDEFDFTENKKIINETLKFIHETKRFEWCDVQIILWSSFFNCLLTVCVQSSLYKFHSHHLIDVHLYKCFTCLDINKNV